MRKALRSNGAQCAREIAAALAGLAGVLLGNACIAQSETIPDGQHLEALDFGRPCANPVPAFDQRNPVDRLTRTSPHSDPATPLTQPDFPQVARRNGMEGAVVVSLLVNEQGEVARARIKKGARFPILNSAALEGVRNWRLRPGTVQGKPVCMWGDFAVSFVLNDYFDEDLAEVTVSPRAERLAALLLGAQNFDDPSGTDEFTAQEHALMKAASSAFLAHRDWLETRRRTAAILTVELSAAEIDEVLKFQESAVAAKLRSLQSKLAPAIGSEGQTAALAFACTTLRIDAALKNLDASRVFDGEQLSRAYEQRISDYAGLATSYCFCRARWDTAAARGIVISGPSCGKEPEFDE